MNTKRALTNNEEADYDCIVIGAGFAGLGLVHHLREAGQSVRAFDKASDIGGTWTWNRYPGAMTDSESYYYCFAFSEEILQEWSWSQRYPGWEEMLKYLHFVADKCNLLPNIQLNTEITSAIYQNDRGLWLLNTAAGEEYTCKYLISGMGMISTPYIPDFKGLGKFNGPCFHSSRWPEGLDYAGKRVGIIGAGATAVQMVPAMADTAASITLFQRTANHIMPAMQKPMTPEWEKEIKDNYPEILNKCRNHVFGMPFDSPVNRLAVETSPEEREEIFERVWQKGGFRFCFETFDDLLSDLDANEAAADFIRRKIKERVKDPDTAELLTPRGYPLFAKRPPLDHGFYEAFNRDDVHLVDIANREPLVEITETGVRTTETDYEFDIIVLATGFDAYTGALECMEIRGAKGETLKEKWRGAPNTIMGVCTADFPNLFMVTGPQAPFANLPTSIEQNISWITNCIKRAESGGYDLVLPRHDAELEWATQTAEIMDQTVMKYGDAAHTWFLGSNIPGKGPLALVYFGGAHVYFDKLRDSVESGFPELDFERLAS